MFNNSKRLKNLLLAMSCIILLNLFFLIPYNYFITGKTFYQTSTENYFLNLLTANNISNFKDISSLFKQIILGKDVIIGIILGVLQGAFIGSFLFYKKKENVYTYNMVLISNLISFIFVFSLILLYKKVFHDVTIVSSQLNQLYVLLFLIALQTITIVFITVQKIGQKLKNTLPLSYSSFQDLLYIFSQWLLSFICFSLIIIIFGGSLIYQMSTLLLNFSEQYLLTLFPTLIQFDLLSNLSNIPNNINTLFNIFEFKKLYFTIQNGVLSISPKEIIQNIENQVNNWFHAKYTEAITPFIYLFISYFVAGFIQIIGYRINKLATPIWSAFIIMISGIYSLTQEPFIFTLIGSILLILGIIYFLLSFDKKFYEGKYTHFIFLYINKWVDSLTKLKNEKISDKSLS